MEITQEAISEQFENMYQLEGYHIAASTNILIPWFQCTLKCKCIAEQAMSQLEAIICKCVKRSINSVKDISFVLALDAEIVFEIVYELAQIGIFLIRDNVISLTESGEKSFIKHSKKEIVTQEFNVFMNGITGEWSSDIIKLKSDTGTTNSIIKLQPIQSVIKSDIENYKNIKAELQTLNNTHIVSMELLEYNLISYTEEKIFFYKNKKRKIIFSIYNTQKKEIDIKLGDTLLRKYEKKELLEIMQVEKYILEREVLVDQYEGKINKFKYYRNKQIRELFKNVFDIAEKSIFIISPWIDNNNFVMTEEILKKMENALTKRNIKISIGYGYISNQKMRRKKMEYSRSNDEYKKLEDKDWQTELMANKLKERFGKYENFCIFLVGTHEKVLSYDDRYTLIGSYNLLSYDGGESDGYNGYSFRFEGGVMIDDVYFANYVKNEIQK